MLLTSSLLNLYFLIDSLLALTLPQDVYFRAAPLYDVIYRAAIKISPYPIPPIYEGITFDGTDD